MRHSALLAGTSLFAIILSSNFARADGYQPRSIGYRPCIANSIEQSNNQLSVDYKSLGMGYEEILDNGKTFDTEKGDVRGFGVAVTFMSTCRQDVLNDLYFRGEYSRYRGDTHYIGGSADGRLPFGSIVDNHRATIDDFDFRLGKGFALGRDFMITPFFGIGHHEWDRAVNAGEDYKNGYYGAGLLLQWSPVHSFVLSADGLIGRTFDANVFVKANPGFNPDTSLDLGSSRIYKVGVSGDYALTPLAHVNAGVEWTGFEYGESPVVNGILEPFSRTRDVTFRVGVGIGFGGPRDSYAPLK